MHRWSILITVQRNATQSSLFIILQVHSTCFGCQRHPSSGVHKTVTTASGTGHIFCAVSSLQRGQLGQAWSRWREVAAQKIWPVPEAVVTVLWPTLPSFATLERGSCTKNVTSNGGCSYSFMYSWLTTLQGGSCTKNMTSTGGCSYSFVYSWLATLQGGSCTKHMTSTGGCSYSFVYSWLATLEGGNCTKNMITTGGCSYSSVYSWWWVWLTPETCRANLQNSK